MEVVTVTDSGLGLMDRGYEYDTWRSGSAQCVLSDWGCQSSGTTSTCALKSGVQIESDTPGDTIPERPESRIVSNGREQDHNEGRYEAEEQAIWLLLRPEQHPQNGA